MLAFDALKSEKMRKECVDAVRKEKAQANAQVLGSSPSVLQRLLSVYALTESPAKQVPSSSAASSAQGSAASTAMSAQVRLCVMPHPERLGRGFPLVSGRLR